MAIRNGILVAALTLLTVASGAPGDAQPGPGWCPPHSPGGCRVACADVAGVTGIRVQHCTVRPANAA